MIVITCQTFILRFTSQTLIITSWACEFWKFLKGRATVVLKCTYTLGFLFVWHFEHFYIAKFTVKSSFIGVFYISLRALCDTVIFKDYVAVSTVRTVTVFCFWNCKIGEWKWVLFCFKIISDWKSLIVKVICKNRIKWYLLPLFALKTL